MAESEFPIQERRDATRTKVVLSCQITFDGCEHDALIADIGPGGAFLLSDFMPPADADILIKIDNSLLGVPLLLWGKILRRAWKETEQGPMGSFAIEFSSSPTALIAFIGELAKPHVL